MTNAEIIELQRKRYNASPRDLIYYWRQEAAQYSKSDDARPALLSCASQLERALASTDTSDNDAEKGK